MKNNNKMNMKKGLLLSVLTLSMSLAVNGQAQLDLQSRAALRAMRSELAADSGSLPQPMRVRAAHVPGGVAMVQPGDCRMVGAMVRVKEGTTEAQLEAEGLQVLGLRGTIALVSMPLDEVETIAAQSRVIRQMQLPRAVKPMNDIARAVTGVDVIHSGKGLPQAYTGKGVVTGIVDAGLDPNHVMFKREDGTSRVEYLTYYIQDNSSQSGISGGWFNRATIDQFTTDDPTTFHGTHTLGTMAGGYKGSSKVASLSDGKATVATSANPYYGMATESDIVASCGTLQDFFIALGMESVLDYADQMNMPAVINLSLGGTTGPHDGTSMISEYMALAEKQDKVIICVAAGNEGDQPLVVSDTLTESRTEVKSFIQPMYAEYPVYNEDGSVAYTYKNLRTGQVYVYSNDSTPFTINAVAYNKTRGKITFRASFSPDNENGSIYYASPDYASEGDLTHPNFTKAFNGYVGVGGLVDEYSGRYYAIVDYFVEDAATNDGSYTFGFEVSGTPGQRIDCYCDGSFTTLTDDGEAGWQNGSSDGTISDMACGDGILVVGSYNSRTDFASLDGKSYTYGEEMPAGKVSSFTSYGTTINGKTLPEVCAPGATIISALSKPYADYTGIGSYLANLQASSKSGSDTYYWMQCVGTSMACPVVAGGIALWLEADPTLTLADVKDIISKTSLRDADVNDDPRWGYGKFDALAGLKEVLRRNGIGMGIGSVASDNSRLLVTSEDLRHFNVFLGGARQMDVAVYDVAGKEVVRFASQGDEADIDATGWAAGTYVVRVNGMYSGKIVVR